MTDEWLTMDASNRSKFQAKYVGYLFGGFVQTFETWLCYVSLYVFLEGTENQTMWRFCGVSINGKIACKVCKKKTSSNAYHFRGPFSWKANEKPKRPDAASENTIGLLVSMFMELTWVLDVHSTSPMPSIVIRLIMSDWQWTMVTQQWCVQR